MKRRQAKFNEKLNPKSMMKFLPLVVKSTIFSCDNLDRMTVLGFPVVLLLYLEQLRYRTPFSPTTTHLKLLLLEHIPS